MGDARFRPYYERVVRASDRAAELQALADEEVVAALAAASMAGDPLLANVLATEAHNRMRRCRAALENLGEGVISVDVEERVTFANPTAGRLLGARPEDLVGAGLHARVRPRAPSEEAACGIERAIREGGKVHCEDERFARADGASFPVAYTVTPVLRDGLVEGAVIVFGDITERKRAEEALRESEARWRGLAEAAFEGVFVHEGGRVLDANRACAEMVGLPRDQLLGRDVLEFVAPACRARVATRMERMGGGAYGIDCVRADGSTFRAEVRGRAFPYGGRIAHVVAIRPQPPRGAAEGAGPDARPR